MALSCNSLGKKGNLLRWGILHEETKKPILKEVRNDHRSKFSNLSNWIGKKKPEKIRASMGFEPVISAILVRCSNQLSYEATHIGSNASKYELFHICFTSSHSSREIWSELHKLALLSTCGFIAQLVEHRTSIAEVTGSNTVEVLIFSGFVFPIA